MCLLTEPQRTGTGDPATAGELHGMRGTSVRALSPGKLVQLRSRLWRIDEVVGDLLTATPLNDLGCLPQGFYSPVEDITEAALPAPPIESLGDPQLQQLLLRAIRLDALHGAAPFISLQRTGIVPIEYQLVPLVMSLRQDPVRLLLADDVGLGKTIEAGLTALELLSRGRARSVLIVTPANLRDQWQEQLRDLFYLEFVIISTERRRRIERTMPQGADVWNYFDRVIVSIDYAKETRNKAEILKRNWDLVIVDEAHNAAQPPEGTHRKADMERHEFVRELANRASKHLLLLTATPHNGYRESFASLLAMLSPGLVDRRPQEIAIDRETAGNHVCQRSRKDVESWFRAEGREFPFAQRDAHEERVTHSKEYYALLDELDRFADDMVKLARSRKSRHVTEWLMLHLQRRALSSPVALRVTLERRIQAIDRWRDAEADVEDREEGENVLASVADRGRTDALDEESIDESADTVALPLELVHQRQGLQRIAALLKDITSAKDAKLRKLRDEVLPDVLQKGTKDTPQRVIVFTRYRDTLDYLQTQLQSGKHRDYDIFGLHGQLSEGERRRRFEEFAKSDRAVLLATDVISEGLNLQDSCAKVIHYDLPWNPNRLEQRVGRVDRFGQRSPAVYVRTLWCSDTTDEDVMEVLVRKVTKIREDQGICPPFFASEVEVLRVVSRRRRKRRMKKGQQATLFDAGVDDEAESELVSEELAKRAKEESFYGQSDVRLSDVSERLREAHACIGSPDQIRSFIRAGLTFFGCVVQEKGDGTLTILLNNPRLRVPGVGEKIEKAVLDPALRAKHPGCTVLDVGHPLIRRLTTLVREQAFQRDQHGGRTTAFYLPGIRDSHLIGQGLLRGIARTEPPVLVEQILTFGIRMGLAGTNILTPEECEAVLNSEVSGRRVRAEDGTQRICDALARPQWEEAQKKAVEEAATELSRQRRAMLEELGASAADLSGWAKGFDQIDVVGFDLFTLSLYIPDV
jgi:ERCC4-related helicase